jgi:hypothetical protein
MPRGALASAGTRPTITARLDEPALVGEDDCLGGLALTLGLEGLRRASGQGRRRVALAGTMLGLADVLTGAAIWLSGGL